VQDGASLDPGAFGAVHLMPGANLNLRAGTYFMESLFLEPGTTVHLDTAAGPIFLYVRSGFTYRGVFIDSQGEHDNLLVGYFGTDVAWIEAPFSGTLVAPRARAEFKSLNGVGSHQGAVFAKEIRLNPQTPFVHHPFGAPWTGGLANVVTLPDSEPGAPTCTDGAANGEETGVDCGGSVCPACGLGMPCVVDSDCTSGACSSGVCAAPALAVSATLTLTSNWGTGYCANVEVRNHDTVATSSWTVVLDAHESVIVNLWNGDATQDGSTYAVENMSYNGQVGPGATTAFGFCANKLGSAYSPEVVSASGG